jgi:hypothetical protein
MSMTAVSAEGLPDAVITGAVSPPVRSLRYAPIRVVPTSVPAVPVPPTTFAKSVHPDTASKVAVLGFSSQVMIAQSPAVGV